MEHTKRLSSTLLALLSGLASLASGLGGEGSPRPNTFQAGQIYCGGHLGFTLPTNIGRKDGDIGFHDVAKVGFSGSLEGMYLVTRAIGLGLEVGYKGWPYSETGTWANLTRYGTFDARYRALDIQATGRFLIGREVCRPFVGIRAGAEISKNFVNFTPDEQHQSFQPTDYQVNCACPTFGPLLGLFIKAGRRALASLTANLNIVPGIKQGSIEVTSEYGDLQTTHYNVHGAQTNFSLTIGFQWGVGAAKNY